MDLAPHGPIVAGAIAEQTDRLIQRLDAISADELRRDERATRLVAHDCDVPLALWGGRARG